MKKIIIADDSKLIRMKLKKILSEFYNVEEADNGRNALAKIKIEPPDLLLTDLLMPEMDGFELLEKIREFGYDFPSVVLTADIQNETVAKCMGLGVYKVLNKPPNSDALLAVLEKALSKEEA